MSPIRPFFRNLMERIGSFGFGPNYEFLVRCHLMETWGSSRSRAEAWSRNLSTGIPELRDVLFFLWGAETFAPLGFFYHAPFSAFSKVSVYQWHLDILWFESQPSYCSKQCLYCILLGAPLLIKSPGILLFFSFIQHNKTRESILKNATSSCIATTVNIF